MPSIKDLFPDKWLIAEALQGKQPTVEIERTTVEELYNRRSRQDEPCLVVAFKGKKLRLVCNKTQATAIAEIAGTEDYTQWKGAHIRLAEAKAPNGKHTIAISAAPATPTQTEASAEYDKDGNPWEDN